MSMYACVWADGDITDLFARTEESALKQKHFEMDVSFVLNQVNRISASSS